MNRGAELDLSTRHNAQANARSNELQVTDRYDFSKDVNGKA